MKTVAAILIAFILLLGEIVLANNVEPEVDAAMFGFNDQESSTQCLEPKLQIGLLANINDGVLFEVDDDKQWTENPQTMYGDSKVELYILALNTTDEDAYLYGWFDFNNNGQFEEGELVVDEKIKSDDKAKVVKEGVKLSDQDFISDEPFVAYFELSHTKDLVTPLGGSNNPGQLNAEEYNVLVMESEGWHGYNKLQIGNNKNKNDGVEFFVDEKKLAKANPKKLDKKGKVELVIQALNTMGVDAYLYVWFDFNNDGEFTEDELIVDEKVKSSDKHRFEEVKKEFELSNRELMNNAAFVAYFELTTIKDLLTPQGAGQNDFNAKKNDDRMMTADDRFSVETRTAGGKDSEEYSVQIIDEDPVAVRLSAFCAQQTADGVVLEWKVEEEVNHAGYNLYRSSNKESGYKKINETLILGWDGFSAFDGAYEYVDDVHGTYYYKLEAIEMDGSTELFGPFSVKSTTGIEDKIEMPDNFKLAQNYPNPFNPSTTISYSLAERSNVAITIFDLSGRIINTLVDGMMEAGTHNVTWHAVNSFGESLPSGVYFYSMKTEGFTSTKSMTIMK